MMYEKSRELAQISIDHWLNEEIFTAGWFIMIGIIAAYYIVWLKLLDKSRAKDLLLLGALGAVFHHLHIMTLTEIFGFVDYSIRALPFQDTFLVSSTSLAPITLMIVQQYTDSWKGYILWGCIGMAFLSFVIFPIYTAIGVLQFHNWNVVYHFITLSAVAMFTRVIFLWIAGIQKRHAHSY